MMKKITPDSPYLPINPTGEDTADNINLSNNETAHHQLLTVIQSVETAKATVDSLLMLALETRI